MSIIKFPLSTEMLNTIKNDIRGIAMSFQIRVIPIDQIGNVPGGRKLVVSFSWPIEEALQYFEKDGAIKITGNQFEIINEEYFNINFSNLSLPIRFSIDQRIEANLAIMTGLYALLYDLENRLRFYIADKLTQKYGADFISHLPRAVRDQIASEKQRIKIFVLDTRNKELEYVDFSDFKKIIQNVDIIDDNTKKQILLDKLDYLNEARTLIAHNNIIATAEIDKVKKYSDAVKKILI